MAKQFTHSYTLISIFSGICFVAVIFFGYQYFKIKLTVSVVLHMRDNLQFKLIQLKKTVINSLPCIQREEYLIAADLTQTATYFKKGSTVVSINLTPTPGNSLTTVTQFYERILNSFEFN